MKCIVIVQSNYIPWKGYFDLINRADEFILFDDVQYTRRDWRNRNRIKTPDSLMWLTIPVEIKGKYFQKIKDTVISNPGWKRNHWNSIVRNYSNAKYYRTYREFFEDLYLNTNERFLSKVNYRFLAAICKILGITTKLSWSMDYRLMEGRTERLVDLCKQTGATEYLSGPAAKPYLDESLFAAEGINVTWMDYSGYPTYCQLFCPPFIHEVSIIDLILNEGAEGAKRHMLSFRQAEKYGRDDQEETRGHIET